MIVVSSSTYPQLRAAFEAIERDNGGHLIGTVYPGRRIDFNEFEVPDAWADLLDPAEQALARLMADSADDFETFVVGEGEESKAVFAQQGDLAEALRLLNDYFDGWPASCLPAAGAST